jgi:hypothetical protein
MAHQEDPAASTPAIDPLAFLERLKRDHQVLRWEPLLPPEGNRPFGVGQVRSRASLEFLHQHWQLPDSYTPEGGGGMKGKVVALFGRMTYRVLGRYLREERDLLAHMVRVSEALERRCDQLTMTMHEMHATMVDRQVAEAKNQAALAVWLHAEPPASTVTGQTRQPEQG